MTVQMSTPCLTWPTMRTTMVLNRRAGAFTGVWLMSLLVLGPGCRNRTADVRLLPAEGEELPILHQVFGKHSHETRAMQLAIRSPQALALVPLRDVPVDFQREMVLIVTLGRIPSDQYAVRIDRVWREGHKLRVATTVQTPQPNAPISMASPYCIAVIPRCDLDVADFDAEPPSRDRSWGQSEPGPLR